MVLRPHYVSRMIALMIHTRTQVPSVVIIALSLALFWWVYALYGLVRVSEGSGQWGSVVVPTALGICTALMLLRSFVATMSWFVFMVFTGVMIIMGLHDIVTLINTYTEETVAARVFYIGANLFISPIWWLMLLHILLLYMIPRTHWAHTCKEGLDESE